MFRALPLLIIFYGYQLQSDPFTQIIVWNVGQGQWITIRHEDVCLNIDTGGDKFPQDYLSACQGENFSVFTHGDRDHLNFFRRSKSELSLGPRVIKNRLSRHLLKFRSATVPNALPSLSTYVLNNSQEKTITNGYSRAFAIKGLLVPGDIDTEGEALLLNQLRRSPIEKIRWLIASHHGSRFGQSSVFLKALQPAQVIVSAAKRRYGHPHREALLRWRKNHLPVLTTEDWGTIKTTSYR